MASPIIRILIVDDHEMVRRGLATFLRTSSDFVLVGEGANGQEAIEQCEILHPDVILMDLMMPEMDGFKAMSVIHERFPRISMIALSSASDMNTVTAAMQVGAKGFLLKNISNDKLASGIRAVYKGEHTFSPEATQALIEAATRTPEPHYQITDRELEVLRLLVEGKNNIEIAKALSVSRSTVKYHVSAILAKLGITNRSEAIAIALKHHLV
jgi:two-component system, NarL family, response regulator LiaR